MPKFTVEVNANIAEEQWPFFKKFGGLNKVVVKSHGGTDQQGFTHAVSQAMEALSAALVAQVAAGI